MIKPNSVNITTRNRKYYITHACGYAADNSGKISIRLETLLSGYKYDEYGVFSCLTAYSTGGVANLIEKKKELLYKIMY